METKRLNRPCSSVKFAGYSTDCTNCSIPLCDRRFQVYFSDIINLHSLTFKFLRHEHYNKTGKGYQKTHQFDHRIANKFCDLCFAESAESSSVKFIEHGK